MSTVAVVAERRTRSAIIRLGSDGILRMVPVPDIAQTLEDAQENVRTGLEMLQGSKPVLLLDVRHAPTLGREPRRYYMSREVQQTITASAIVLRQHAGTTLLRYVSAVLQGSVPSRVFTNEEAAVQWLQRFTKK